MEHHLVYKDSKSDKFWKIKVRGKMFTVTYGKTGTNGQTQIKSFNSREECIEEAKKLVNEKLKKGYTEQSNQTKQKTTKTPPKAEFDKGQIITLLKSKRLDDIEAGIYQLGLFVEKKKSHHNNPLYEFFDLDKEDLDETELVEIEVLDSILSNFKRKLSAESLITIIHATMGSVIYDNFAATIHAIEIAIERKDDSIQNAIVKTFKEACQYYDAGHRFDEATVQDQLIDDLFPQFEGEPLVNLLTWCKTDYLQVDGMDALFRPAFEKIRNDKALEKKLLKCFNEYLEDCSKEYRKSGILDGFEEASEKIKSAIAEFREDKSLDKLISDYHRKGKSESKQYNIVVTLRDYNDPRTIQLLLEAMNHEWDAVVREAIYSLGHLKAEEAVPQIIDKLRSKNGQHITAAACALSQIGNEECLSVLKDDSNYQHVLQVTQNTKLFQGRFSVNALQYFANTALNDNLLELLIQSKDHEIEQAAEKILIKRAAEEKIATYAEHITSKKLIERSGKTLLRLIIGIASRIESPNQKNISVIANIFNNISMADLEFLAGKCESSLNDFACMAAQEKKRAQNWCETLILNIESAHKKNLVKKMLLDLDHLDELRASFRRSIEEWSRDNR